MTKKYVSEAFDVLSDGLDSFFTMRMKGIAESLEWTSILEELDKSRGRSGWTYSRTDPSLQLRMLTERLGNLGYPFDAGDKNRTLSSYGSVLRINRNRLAHGDVFEVFDALNVVETARTVLSHIGDDVRAGQAADIRSGLIAELLAEETDTKTAGQPDETQPDPEQWDTCTDWPQTEDPSGRAVPWEAWTTVVVGEQQDLDSMRTNRVKELVRSLIEDIAEVEGPVHPERVARLVGLGFGFSRLSAARMKKIIAQIPKSSVVVDGYGHVWAEGVVHEDWLIYRTSPDDRRPFEQISPVEIANAVAAVSQSDDSLTDAELRSRVLGEFGRKRGSKSANPQLELGIAHAKAGNVV